MARQDEMQIPLPLATGVAECAPDLSLSRTRTTYATKADLYQVALAIVVANAAITFGLLKLVP